MRGGPSPAIALILLLSVAPAGPAAAAPVKIFRAQSAQQFLTGTFEGISLDPIGALRLADRAERVAALEEPFLLAAAAHPRGWVLGTGNAGRVLLVDRSGKASTLFQAPEPEVFAVWSDADGTVYAGTSPQGKVYRIANGKGEVWFEPGETYIWAIQRAADGSLLVATGTQGRLYKVTGRAAGKVFYDSDDTHIRALQALPTGDVLLGTAGEGLVLRVDAQGRARTLYDADKPEIVGFAVAPDGTAYTAALQSEAGLVGQAESQGREGKSGKEDGSAKQEEKGEVQAVVTVTAEGEGSPPAAARGQRSEVLRIAPGGAVDSVWTFDNETVYALAWQRGRLWVGTGLDGKLYSLQSGRMVLEKDVDERQIVALAADDPGPAFATTNAAALYRLASGPERSGTYTSIALDAGQIARFGVFRWTGDEAGSARFSFRSGVSAEPDRTWSAWSEARSGRELSLADLPPGRYVQWRAELAVAGQAASSPRITETELSYRQENLAPKITRFGPLEPGQILVPANFNPGNQIYEPAHPARDGIFTTLTPADEDGDTRWKPLWKKGYRTLRWEASDPNGDELRYALEFKPEDAAGWLTMTKELDEDHYGFDATVLPDGVYRFRLRASDSEANADGGGLASEEISEPVVVDNTPPRLRGIRRDGARLRVDLEDALSPMREAVVSVDGADWRPAQAEDGLLDGRRETLVVERPAGARLLLARITDAANNVVTFDLGDAP